MAPQRFRPPPQVYTWRVTSANLRSLFKPWDDWPALGKREVSSFQAPHIFEGILCNSWELLPASAATATEAAGGAGAAAGPSAGAGAGPGPSSAAAGRGPGSSAGAVDEQRRVRGMFADLQSLRSRCALPSAGGGGDGNGKDLL